MSDTSTLFLLAYALQDSTEGATYIWGWNENSSFELVEGTIRTEAFKQTPGRLIAPLGSYRLGRFTIQNSDAIPHVDVLSGGKKPSVPLGEDKALASLKPFFGSRKENRRLSGLVLCY